MRQRDVEQREDSLRERIDAAKRRYAALLVVINGVSDGLTDTEIGSRIGLGRNSVWKLKVFLGLVSGKQWRGTGRRTGRLDTKRALMEVRP